MDTALGDKVSSGLTSTNSSPIHAADISPSWQKLSRCVPLLGGSGSHAQLAGGVWVKYYEFSRTVFGARPGPGLAATDPQASSAPGCALLPAAAEQHRRATTRIYLVELNL